MPLTSSEYGCFEWYMHRSAVKLPGAFVSERWTMLLFQASTTEPAIRHAMLALGSAHKEEVRRGASSSALESNDEQSLFTVRQYNRAIDCLKPCFSDSRRISLRITLVSCALFIYAEFLRGHYTKGIIHLEHGLTLLPGIGKSAESRDPSSTLVDGWLITIFTRLLVQAKLFGQSLRVSCQSFLDSSLQRSPDVFRSTHHARRRLEQILLRTFYLQEQSDQLTANGTTTPLIDLLNYQNSIQMELQLWLKNYETTMENLPPTHNALELFAYRLLRLYHRLAVILAGTCLESSSELRFDLYDPSFSDIISHCIETYQMRFPNGKRDVRAHHDPEPTSPNSVSDIGWIVPLYFTALKCRNHRIRHQAIKLLESSLHKEGMWSSTLAVLVARQVVEIEEGNFYEHIGSKDDQFDMLSAPTDEDLATSSLPEEFRLSKIDVVLPADGAGKLLLRCCREQRSGTINWTQKEYDLLSGQWNDTAGIMEGGSSRESAVQNSTT